MQTSSLGHEWSYQCEHSAPVEWRHWIFSDYWWGSFKGVVGGEGGGGFGFIPGFFVFLFFNLFIYLFIYYYFSRAAAGKVPSIVAV